jgi:hypothetical protein
MLFELSLLLALNLLLLTVILLAAILGAMLMSEQSAYRDQDAPAECDDDPEQNTSIRGPWHR